MSQELPFLTRTDGLHKEYPGSSQGPFRPYTIHGRGHGCECTNGWKIVLGHPVQPPPRVLRNRVWINHSLSFSTTGPRVGVDWMVMRGKC